MENTSKNFFETMTEMQKKVVENFTGASEKFQKNFTQTNFIESDPFKKWYDSQMSFFNQKGDKKTENEPMAFFNSWIENQAAMAKNWFEETKNAATKLSSDLNMTNPNMDMFNNWMETVNNTYGEMAKNFNANNDAKSSFSGLFNNSQNYMKMFEIWMPMLNSLQNKSFTPESFKQMFNAQMFKGMMDNVFNMQPDYMKNMMKGFDVKGGFENFAQQGKTYYDTFSQNLHKGLADGNNVFGQVNTMYNNFNNTVTNAMSPLMKMMTPGTQKDQMNMMTELMNDLNQYNLLNSQMQYMMYVTGVKAMENVSESVYSKMKNGEDMSDFAKIYQEWLGINDKQFVTLFDSDDYSKMQGELNSYGMKLKQKVNQQMEKSLANLPLINRTEMDELYKTIYDLRKQMTEMQKAFKESLVKKETVSKSEAEPKKESAPAASASVAGTKPVAEAKPVSKPAAKKV